MSKFTNKTEQAIMEALAAAKVTIHYPITVNKSNVDKDYDICCNYMSTGVHLPVDAVDESDFAALESKQILLHKTWTWLG